MKKDEEILHITDIGWDLREDELMRAVGRDVRVLSIRGNQYGSQ